jgi:hypothetical protein
MPIPLGEMSLSETQIKIVAGLALAAAIAWVAPFDLAFGYLTLGVPALRAAGIVVLALVGHQFGRRIGMRLEPVGVARPWLTPVGIAAVVAVNCALADGLFRSALHDDFVTAMTMTPIAVRVVVFMMRAVNENIIYRLFLTPVLIWALGLVWTTPQGQPTSGAFWTGIAVAQAINTWINVTAHAPLTSLAVLHDAIRYVGPGMVWGWLYWRRAFQSCEVACTTVHLFYQPLITLALAL